MIGGRNRASPGDVEETLSNGGFGPVRVSYTDPRPEPQFGFDYGPEGHMGTLWHRIYLRAQNEPPVIRIGFPERNTVQFEDVHGRKYVGGPGKRAVVSNARARFIAENQENTALERA